MARIKHIAIRTNDVEKTAAFYREAFGLEDAGNGKNGVYLTDGRINLAILKVAGPSGRTGVDHLGFQVDDLEEAVATAQRVGALTISDPARIAPTDPSNRQSYFEFKLTGPDNQEIDVSETGWAGAKGD